MRTYKDIPYSAVADKDHLLDLYLPDGECDALFLFFHGGGLEWGNRDEAVKIPGFINDMTNAGFGVASAEYRMYPEAKFPDFIEDAAMAVKFVKSGIHQYCNYKKLVVGGSSAGGYISMMLCYDEKYLEAAGVLATDIDGYVFDAGQPTVHFRVLKERGIDYRRIIVDDASPLYHVGKADSYPPIELIVSDNDIENRAEQIDLLVGAMRHFGYDMSKVHLTKTHGNHVWYIKADKEDGKSVYGNIIIPFIKSII